MQTQAQTIYCASDCMLLVRQVSCPDIDISLPISNEFSPWKCSPRAERDDFVTGNSVLHVPGQRHVNMKSNTDITDLFPSHHVPCPRSAQLSHPALMRWWNTPPFSLMPPLARHLVNGPDGRVQLIHWLLLLFGSDFKLYYSYRLMILSVSWYVRFRSSWY